MRFGHLILAPLLAAASAASPVATPTFRTVPLGTSIDWTYQRGDRPVRYQVGPVRLWVRGEDRSSAHHVAGIPRATVEMAGFASIELEGGEGSDRANWNRFAAARWDAKRHYVLLQSWTGGAHCCVKFQVAYPEGTQLRAVTLGQWDMEFLDKPPIDLNGDGRLDFMFASAGFPRDFIEAYADGFTQPQIINVIGGQVIDVSADPDFRRLFLKPMQQQRGACLGLEDRYKNRRKGACAAYAASAARLGRFDQSWAEIAKAYDGDATWPSLDSFNTYRHDVRRFLIKDGYISG